MTSGSTDRVPEWHVSVVVPVLVRGGTQEEARSAAVEHVDGRLDHRTGLDADLRLSLVMESEPLEDDCIDLHLPTQTGRSGPSRS